MSLGLSILIFFSCAVALVALPPDGSTLNARRAKLKAALEEEWQHQLRTYPELATSVGDNRYNDRLADYSAQAIAREIDHENQALARFEAIDTTGFPTRRA